MARPPIAASTRAPYPAALAPSETKPPVAPATVAKATSEGLILCPDTDWPAMLPRAPEAPLTTTVPAVPNVKPATAPPAAPKVVAAAISTTLPP